MFICFGEKGLGLSQTEGFRFGLEQPAVQLPPFGWGSLSLLHRGSTPELLAGASVSEYLHERRCGVWCVGFYVSVCLGQEAQALGDDSPASQLQPPALSPAAPAPSGWDQAGAWFVVSAASALALGPAAPGAWEEARNKAGWEPEWGPPLPRRPDRAGRSLRKHEAERR